ncbi:MAG: hypothetical protein AB8V73_01740 [Coxiella endosymbiont of Dermacentor nuttalli]
MHYALLSQALSSVEFIFNGPFIEKPVIMSGRYLKTKFRQGITALFLN